MRWVLLALACALLSAGERQRIPLLGFFNEHELQVIFPPASSLAHLAWDYQAMPAYNTPIIDEYERVILVEAYSPYTGGFYGAVQSIQKPNDLVCLGFIDENDRGDVVRCVFRAGGWKVQDAEAQHLSSFTVSPVDDGGSAVATAQRVADRIFRSDEQVTLKWVGRDEGVDFGVHDNDATGTIDEQFGVRIEHWRNKLKWFKRGPEVGFLILNDIGDFRQFSITRPELTHGWLPWPR